MNDFQNWTACEMYGHNYTASELNAGRMVCLDCGESYETLTEVAALGLCTHCGKEQATEIHSSGYPRLCAKCTELRKNEDWNLPTGIMQEGENCERFQGEER